MACFKNRHFLLREWGSFQNSLWICCQCASSFHAACDCIDSEGLPVFNFILFWIEIALVSKGGSVCY